MRDSASSQPDAEPMIRLSEVEVTLTGAAGPVNILRGVNLMVLPGETVAIAGPSGSGKSTLLAIIGGLERASRGRVEVAGADFGRLDEDRLARVRRDRIGFVFQAFHLVPSMTALENVAIPLDLAGRRDAVSIARERLEFVGLGHRLAHYPHELSGGEQQRVALARAMVACPPLLLADEPTGNLDAANGARVIELMLGLRADYGSTLVLVTHDPALAQRCDRVISLQDGWIVADRPRASCSVPST